MTYFVIMGSRIPEPLFNLSITGYYSWILKGICTCTHVH